MMNKWTIKMRGEGGEEASEKKGRRREKGEKKKITLL